MTKTKTEKKRVRKPPNPGKAAPQLKPARSGDRKALAGVSVAPALAAVGKENASSAPKSAPRGKPAAKPEKKGLSSVGLIRQVLATDPEASVEDIGKVLDKAGLSKPADTVRTIRSDFHGTYRALVKAGALKNPATLA